jgi:predicted AlkP superfamily pyrophosphatase or phosphodiesterase
MRKIILAAFIFFPLSLFAAQSPPPKLILQLTIDQFSGNQLQRFKQHLDTGGFKYLIEHGIWFDNAHQYHASTQTAVGHTTLATGAVPAVHGIIANYWWDREKKKEIYAMNDEKLGVSPRNILVPSFSDALGIATNFQSKRFAVSTKDRGAIPLAGKMGKAFWLNKETGDYVSSQYYYETLPKWADRWNKKEKAKKYIGNKWTLKKPCLQYQFCHDGKKHLKTYLTRFNTQFPHPYGKTFNESYLNHLTKSPISDTLTLDFTQQLVMAEKLGTHDVTDYLSISLSATDAVGHTFGPYSLESEDNFVRLNQALGHFFKFIDKQIGLKNVLIVLSADHGAGPSPTYLSNDHYPTFEISEKDIQHNKQVQAVLDTYQLKLNKLLTNEFPLLYLNEAYLAEKKIDKDTLSMALAKAIESTKGIYAVIPTFLIKDNKYSHPFLLPLLKNVINDKRSGDLYIIAEPHIYFGDKTYSSANHGSPWRYDTHVPLIFVRDDFKPQRIHRKANTIDLAPTLSALLHIAPPSGSMGATLKEVTE